MKTHVKLFESWLREEEIVLTRGRAEIRILTRHGKIEEIVNDDRVPIPFFIGQPVTVFLRGWACSQNYKWNGKSACPDEEKVFGIKKKWIPQGHELRRMYPSKFSGSSGS
jgi:hypothetical protein